MIVKGGRRCDSFPNGVVDIDTQDGSPHSQFGYIGECKGNWVVMGKVYPCCSCGKFRPSLPQLCLRVR